MEFKRGMLQSYCSCTCVDRENIVLVGGCQQFDVNMKSHDIFKLNLISKEIVKVGDLPYGVSSHGAKMIDNRLFIVGGNLHFSMVTRKCLVIDL